MGSHIVRYSGHATQVRLTGKITSRRQPNTGFGEGAKTTRRCQPSPTGQPESTVEASSRIATPHGASGLNKSCEVYNLHTRGDGLPHLLQLKDVFHGI